MGESTDSTTPITVIPASDPEKDDADQRDGDVHNKEDALPASGNEKDEAGQQHDGDVHKEDALPAYLLEWTDAGAIADANTDGAADVGITKTAIQDLAGVQSCMTQARGFTIHHGYHHLFVFHGLPVSYGAELQKATGLDPAFIDAHAGRRSYRPSYRNTVTNPSTNSRRRAAAWAHFDYPELISPVNSSDGNNEARRQAAMKDLLGDAPVYKFSTSDREGGGAVFCRASMWLGDKAWVLYLDRSTSDAVRPGPARRYRMYTSERLPKDVNGTSSIMVVVQTDGPGANNPATNTNTTTAPTTTATTTNTTTIYGDEIPSLETLLYSGLQDGCGGGTDRAALLDLLEEIAITKWEDFFEALSMDFALVTSPAVMMALLLSQTAACLERNLDVSRHLFDLRRRGSLGSGGGMSMVTRWEELLKRLDRLGRLLGDLRPAVVEKTTANTTTGTTTTASTAAKPAQPQPHPSPPASRKSDTSSDASYGANAWGYIPCRPNRKPRNNNNGNNVSNHSSATKNPDENERSLNRVTYLGGVLLPFSIVSGILAINGSYGPGGAQFWVFWAAAVPLALLTLGVIYADSIRKSEVWVEVASAAANAKMPPEHEHHHHRQQHNGEALHAVPANMGTGNGRAAEPVVYAVPEDLGPEERYLQPVGRYSAPNGDIIVDEEPDRVIERRWAFLTRRRRRGEQDAERAAAKRNKAWRREELGWGGAFGNMLGLYKVRTRSRAEGERYREG
ncbi:hypothetical protein F4777DRAFT_399322 [Nemania sp. FL0916]|nr:hypothetical protein F4777DRAFT_399322 [Nemania sp. FL0916]